MQSSDEHPDKQRDAHLQYGQRPGDLKQPVASAGTGPLNQQFSGSHVSEASRFTPPPAAPTLPEQSASGFPPFSGGSQTSQFKLLPSASQHSGQFRPVGSGSDQRQPAGSQTTGQLPPQLPPAGTGGQTFSGSPVPDYLLPGMLHLSSGPLSTQQTTPGQPPLRMLPPGQAPGIVPVPRQQLPGEGQSSAGGRQFWPKSLSGEDRLAELSRSLGSLKSDLLESLASSQLTSANLTRVLTAILPGVDESSPAATTRVPVTIKASMKRPEAPPPPLPPDQHKKRRQRLSLLGAGLFLLILIMTLFSVTPLGHEIGLDNPLDIPHSGIIMGQNPGLNNLVAQATATAVYHRKTDGFDPSFYGSQLIGNGHSSLGWPFGQCTYWANYEYHRLTGHWVSWNGNADQWVTGARMAGWSVSTVPHVPSILVMMPYTQRASGYGHVAVVEGVSGSTVHTSNMNWWTNGGGWGRVSRVDFSTGPGIYFVWHT